MTLLRDTEIQAYLYSGKLVTDYAATSLQAASYDLRLGRNVFLSRESTTRNLTKGESLTLLPGDFALVQTYEKLCLPPSIRGRVGLRSRFSLAGLVNLSGPQVDPGFTGYLTMGVVNIGPTPRTLKFMDRMFTMEFDDLGIDVAKPYSGEFSEMEGIPAFLIDALTHGEGISLPRLVTSIKALEERMSSMNRLVNVLLVPVILALFALAGAVAFELLKR